MAIRVDLHLDRKHIPNGPSAVGNSARRPEPYTGDRWSASELDAWSECDYAYTDMLLVVASRKQAMGYTLGSKEVMLSRKTWRTGSHVSMSELRSPRQQATWSMELLHVDSFGA